MMREIDEQPAALERTFRDEFPRMRRFRAVLERRRPRLVILVARGTSDNAALFGRYLLETTTGMWASLAAPSVHTVYRAKVCWKETLVVGLSQSGESTDTNMCLDAARKGGALTIGITNSASSSITKSADEIFLVRAGLEKSVAATKTYTGQLLMIYMLAHALGAPLDPKLLQKLPSLAASALRLKPAVTALAERYRYMERAVVVGRGLNYANAFEFSLKMMETCYVVAERFSSADFLHGPIALVERAFPVFLFAPPGPTWKSNRLMLQKLRELEAETIVISGEASTALNYATRRITVPGAIPAPRGLPADILTPIPFIIPGQLFAAALAAEKGLDPDRPRTLTKVTRTV